MSCGIVNAIAFSPTMAYCWVCHKIRQKKGEDSDLCGFTPFSKWDTEYGKETPMHAWEKIGLIIIMVLNIFGLPAFLIGYINVNHIPLVREDIGKPEVYTPAIIASSIGLAIILGLILWAVLGDYDKNAPKCCRFGHSYTSDDKDDELELRQPKSIYCAKCGKDFGEYRLLSTMDKTTGKITDYDKDGKVK